MTKPLGGWWLFAVNMAALVFLCSQMGGLAWLVVPSAWFCGASFAVLMEWQRNQ